MGRTQNTCKRLFYKRKFILFSAAPCSSRFSGLAEGAFLELWNWWSWIYQRAKR